MKRLSNKELFILGFMNFALFVGAGNIIFPPFIGLQAGTSVWVAAVGFLITAVGLPVITAIAMAKCNGEMSEITKPIGSGCSLLMVVSCYLCIGPFFAIPRTATVSYELALQHLAVSNYWLPLWSLCYFCIVIVVALYPNRLLDTVGKFLSPLKIVALIVLAATALILPAGKAQAPVAAYADSPFSQGITNGYLTMDTLAALVFGLVIVGAIQSRGVTAPHLISRYAMLAGLIAGIGLSLVYLSLFRLGMSSTTIANNATNGAQVLSAFVFHSYGTVGTGFLAVLITLACLVTAIGLTCACASYFSRITGIRYSVFVWIIAGFSMLVSNLGLTQLIKISVPALTIIYPVFVVLIVTYFFNHRFKSSARVIAPAALIAFIFGVTEALESLGYNSVTRVFAKHFPLHDQGLAWLVPVIMTLFFTFIFDRLCNTD